MPYDYYYRLSPRRRRTYRASDRVTSLDLGDPARAAPHVRALQRALAEGSPAATQDAAQAVADALLASLGAPRVRVRVLRQRPSQSRGELHGLYEPGRGGEPDRITVWMRTARHKRVVAFKTFLRTLVHELCHYLDYELLGLDDTFHTEGFFKRESSLCRQLLDGARDQT